MKSKPIIFIMILALLVNHAAISAMVLSDSSSSHAGIGVQIAQCENGSAQSGHDEHATHCCHIQSHFQTILSQNSLLDVGPVHTAWERQLMGQPSTLKFSPPIPPPKA